MDVNEEYVETLLNMGFPNENQIRYALRTCKNDMNEAITLLTSDVPIHYEDFNNMEVEMKEVSRTTQSSSQPPSYDEVVEYDFGNTKESTQNDEGNGEENPLEFPAQNLFELEGRVYTDSWSIPYKKNESLGKCLIVATRLAEQGLCESDENCVRFLNKCVPECINKLMNASAVNRWGADIQEGVYDMLLMFVDLVAARLTYRPVPVTLLELIALVFNPDTEYHIKNRSRQVERGEKEQWVEALGGAQAVYARTHSYHEWLCNLVNRFAARKGVEEITKLLEADDLTAPEYAALIAPFGTCAAFLNCAVVRPLVEPGLQAAVHYVQNMSQDQLKHKSVISVCDLLVSTKLLSLEMWRNDDDKRLDNLRLDFVLRLLKSPHFNARMNGLKEITKMMEESSGTKVPKTAISQRVIENWLHDNKVLAVALEGNIDQSQYCDKIKNVVDFLGPQLIPDELTKMWNMQRGQSNVVIDNIHAIIAAAAVRLPPDLLEHLFILVRKTWQAESAMMREKLLRLLGFVGRETRKPTTASLVLEVLWELAHVSSLSTCLMESALREHLHVLSDANSVKESLKKHYVIKCVEDIKEGKWVLPALRHLLQITKHIAKNSFHKADKPILQELNKNHDIVKQVTSSLIRFHEVARRCCHGDKLTPEVLVDSRYTHRDYVTTHLEFLQFILQEVMLCLSWNRARELWTTLISNQNACEWDRQTAFEWFTKGITDLEHETQSQLFQKEFLKLDPGKITEKGFTCYQSYFESVNVYEHRLKKSGTIYLVEKPELIGMDFLWEICLNVQDTEITDKAMELLITMSYANLNHRLKKDPDVLHRKFISECYCRLQGALSPEGRAIHNLLADASRILASACVPEFGSVPCPAKTTNLLNMERLLLIAERYVVAVEESYSANRSIPPHGASFHGQPMTLFITCENPKMDFNLMVHSNQTVGSLRTRVGKKLNLFADNLQLVVNEQILCKEQKLLRQVGLEDSQVVCAKSYSHTPSLMDHSATSTRQSSLDHEQEKMLPGVIMSSGGQVFDLLYQMAELEEPKITSRVRNLLSLIPTDASVQDALEGLSRRSFLKPTRPPSMEFPTGTRSTSPKKSSSSVSPAPTPPSTPTFSNPRETLRSLFDNQGPNKSTFRLLYNLEVLSSKLMPTTNDLTTQKSARTFCEDFLNAGGLQLVVNILQTDMLAPDVDYETRQGCYSIALQLLRFLLCGENAYGEPCETRFCPAGRRERHASTASGGELGSSRERSTSTSGSTGTPRERTRSSSGYGSGLGRERTSSSSGYGSTPGSGRERTNSTSSAGTLLLSSSLGSNSSIIHENTAALRAVQTMNVTEFNDTVACFMRVAWAAAAGKLHLASSNQPIKDSGMYGTQRSRQSSTGSTNSSSSDSESQCLHPGVCLKHTTVGATDALIAKESLELLVTCLQLRSPLLASFYKLPFVGDFVVDLLVGSQHADVRDAALQQFWLLAQTEVSPAETGGHQQAPQHFLIHALMKARLPFWVSSSCTRGASHRLLKQCSQYFDLKCKLLQGLSLSQQKQLGLQLERMLEDEIGWLHNFMPSPHAEETDNLLIAGHLKLIRALVMCEGVDREKIGGQLIRELLREFLFPASTTMKNAGDKSRYSNISPKCSQSVSRLEAYDLLLELCTGCMHNLHSVCTELHSMHQQNHTDASHQWEYLPPVDGRSKAGYVGLRNGGATCYMNSVLQQLYMTPGVKDAILATEEDNADEESVFYQLQQIFAHLLDSKLQYYVPEKFWKVFKLWGQTVNVREQQDALDFYQAVIDQVDEHLKAIGKDSVFKKKFQGVFSDQKICKGCPHRYEREEIFYALNVTVKNASLQDSLEQFVKGELLEGDNAYFCEKCGEKRDTVKRMCIKQLPPVLCIQLKRFGYDWEANRALKFDDHFKFPWVLDMEPFTSDGMSRREGTTLADDQSDSQSDTESSSQTQNQTEEEDDAPIMITTIPNTPSKQINYELVGIVVHSGQANAGHYYSYIKDRRGNYMNNPSKGKWYKFNDTDVEPFEMTDSALEEECFGGTYKAKVYEQSGSYPEERQRYWNGYLLLYERSDSVRTPVSAKRSKMLLRKSLTERTPSTKRNSDSLVELTELVHKGEKKGIFTDSMPAHIQRVVQEENLRFLQNRDVYDSDYFRFVRALASRNTSENVAVGVCEKTCAELSLESLQLAVHFLFNIYLRTKRKLRTDMNEWKGVIEDILQRSKPATVWLIEYLGSTEGKAYIKPFLLECNTKELRVLFGGILESAIKSFFQHGGMPLQKCFDEFLETLLHMLNKDVPDHCNHCPQYFSVLLSYAQMDTKSCSHLFGRRAFQRLAFFLLGEAHTSVSQNTESNTRRWSSLQSRDFGALHETMATLVLHCDVSPYRTEPVGDFPVRKPVTCNPQPFLKMNSEMQKYVFGKDSHRYIREAVLALREVPTHLWCVEDMLLTCSFCNQAFSMTLIKHMMVQYTSAPSNELKHLLSALLKLLLLADNLQVRRLETVIDGFTDAHEKHYEGMLAVIKSEHLSDSRRSYQCIKLLVSLAQQCDVAKDFLLQRNAKWQWAVNWLKKKMNENSWTNSTLSNESSETKMFQRTISAQGTLDGATALLTELETSDASDMDTNSQPNTDTDADTQPYSQGDSEKSEKSDVQTEKKLRTQEENGG